MPDINTLLLFYEYVKLYTILAVSAIVAGKGSLDDTQIVRAKFSYSGQKQVGQAQRA
jgi:hypothetical protein